MKKFMLFAIITLGLATLSAAQTQIATNNTPLVVLTSDTHTSTTLVNPQYSEVFYHRMEDGKLVSLPHTTPKDSSKFKASLSVAKDAEARTETPNPTFVVQVGGTGEPSSKILLTPIQDGKIPLGKDSESSFSKKVKVNVSELANRVFEVKPAELLTPGVYALAIKSDNPFSIPECYIFRVD